MSLRIKFALLLGLLALTLIVNALASGWSLETLEREYARPLVSIEGVLRDLAAAKRAFGTQHNLIATSQAAIGPSPEESDEPLNERLSRLSASASAALDRLESQETYRLRSGISTTVNLRARFDEARLDLDRWIGQSDPGARDRATDALFELHELIERVEGRIVEDAFLATTHADAQRTTINRILLASAASVVLAVGLGLRLVRRWVLSPVAALRLAADRIAAGDFAHRIPTPELPAARTDELDLLSREVNHMAQMVTRMQEERVERERLAAIGEMARRVVHNLRTPLAGVRGLAELTRSGLAPSDDLRECQERIIQSVDRADAWLRQLLNVSRPLDLRLQTVDLRPWLERVIDARRPQASSRGIEIRCNGERAPRHVDVDPTHLEHAIAALLDNALQASPEQGMVSVEIESDNSVWRVRISDQGQGVPPEARSSLFKPYFTTKPTGTGIGLAMARQIVTAHRGRVWHEDGPGGPGNAVGATFVVELPLSDEARLASIGQTGAIRGQNSGHRG